MTYLRYIRFAKPCINYNALLPLLERLSAEGGTWKNLGIWHLNFSVLYSSEPSDVELMVGAVDYFIKDITKSTVFHAPSFYSAAKSTVAKLCNIHLDFAPRFTLIHVLHVSEVAGTAPFLPNVQAVVLQQHALVQLRP